MVIMTPNCLHTRYVYILSIIHDQSHGGVSNGIIHKN